VRPQSDAIRSTCLKDLVESRHFVQSNRIYQLMRLTKTHLHEVAARAVSAATAVAVVAAKHTDLQLEAISVREYV